MSGHFRRNIGRYLKVVASAVIFLLMLEICARLDDAIKYGAPFWSNYTDTKLRAIDADGIRYNIPNSRFEKWQINKFGFRGPDFPPQKAENEIRIACMGTSETYGIYESASKEWPAQLADMLSGDGRFRIINAATVGLSMHLYSEYLKKYVFKYDPDIIILLVNPLSNMAGFKNENRQRRPGQPDYSLQNVNETRFRIKPKIKQMVKKFIPGWMLKHYQLWGRQRIIDNLEKHRLKGKQPLDSIPHEFLHEYRQQLDEIIETVQARNIKIIIGTYPILISPTNIDKYPEIFMENRRFMIESSYKGMVDASMKADSIMKDAAIYYNIDFIDNHRQIPKNTKYFADNVHLTDAGSELMAKSFKDYILLHYGILQ
jgi:lysophospholipase L1-like esterase